VAGRADLDYAAMTASTRAQEVAIRPVNTSKAYDPKKIEFLRFCDAVFEDEPEPGRYFVTRRKAFMFVWYHAHRPKRSSGSVRNRASGEVGDDVTHVADERQVPPLNTDEYRQLLDTYGGDNLNENEALPDEAVAPPNCLGDSQVRAYSGAVRDVWADQHRRGINPLFWDGDINNIGLKSLMRLIRSREARVKHHNAHEKIDQEVIPFLLATKIEEIGLAFWNKALLVGQRVDSRTVLSALRDRFTYLMTTRAILRGESVLRADLSDLFSVSFRQTEGDPHDLQVLILQMAFGKTNRGRKLQGRAMRHKHPYECVMYALAMYLWFRFKHTGEMENPPDFTDNDEWFKIKLLVGSNVSIVKEHDGMEVIDRSAVTTQMHSATYASAVKGVLNALGIPTDKQCHIGRATGPRLAEMMELSEQQIQNLGNWEPSQRQEIYSEKIPLQALRVMNGHSHLRGSVYIPRFTMDIPLALQALAQQQIFPWAESKLADVQRASAADGRSRHTAAYFLNMLIQLRHLILQDTAEIMTYSEPRQHPLFTEPIFTSQLFGEYVAAMKTHLAQAPAADPLNMSMEAALPGVMNRFDQLQTCLNQLRELARTGAFQNTSLLEIVLVRIESLHERLEHLTNATDRHERLAHTLSVAFSDFANGSRPVAAVQPQFQPPPVPEAGNVVRFGFGASQVPLARAGALAPAPQLPQAANAAPWIPREPGHGAKLSVFHASFSALFDEYRGSGRSEAPGQEYNYDGKPIEGGFQALEAKGSAWRTPYYSNKERAHFCRVKKVVESVLKRMEASNDPDAVMYQLIEHYDALFAKASEEAMAKFNGDKTTDRRIELMTELLIDEEYLPPRQKRNRNRANEAQAPQQNRMQAPQARAMAV
jgi:Centromere DNA-binding protein complex CBF3 subunit, domain 2